jgi:hypothetical protein
MLVSIAMSVPDQPYQGSAAEPPHAPVDPLPPVPLFQFV